MDTDFPMFRLADAYLIYAEAVLRGGGGSPDQALAYLNAIRQRVYGDASGNVPADSSLCSRLHPQRAEPRAAVGGAPPDRPGALRPVHRRWRRCGPWKGGVQPGTATETFRDLDPWPQSELVTNPNLTQNPGY